MVVEIDFDSGFGELAQVGYYPPVFVVVAAELVIAAAAAELSIAVDAVASFCNYVATAVVRFAVALLSSRRSAEGIPSFLFVERLNRKKVLLQEELPELVQS